MLFLSHVVATNTTSSQIIKDSETQTSNGGNFTLGFFTPQNSTNRYVGIWCKTQDFVIWVANRNQPMINDSLGVLTISNDGNQLVVLNGQKRVIWSSNVSNVSTKTNSSFTLSDYGNLVLMDTTTENKIWESFNHPSNALFPTMKYTSNMKLTSWRTTFDPSIGNSSLSTEG
ncbi:non-specific serine/threonine protein kinase [Trifolium repens]|nr:non-specific serine/threonine protein kinase [Trifolium repens]